MTTPAHELQIGVSDINTELRRAYNAQADYAWMNTLIKSGQRPGNPSSHGFHNLTYYRKTNDGNCDNGNQVHCNCNCGNKNCTNCTNCNAINCVNCDAQDWLQSNCNCACTYNCNVNSVSFNCDCDCFVCNCW